MVKVTPPVSVDDITWSEAPTEEQLKARRADREALHATRMRKLDTRGKVILGGALLALVEQKDEAATAMFEELVSALPREADRKTMARVRKLWRV